MQEDEEKRNIGGGIFFLYFFEETFPNHLPKVGQSVPVSAQINQSAFQKSFPFTPNLPDAVLMFLIIG